MPSGEASNDPYSDCSEHASKAASLGVHSPSSTPPSPRPTGKDDYQYDYTPESDDLPAKTKISQDSWCLRKIFQEVPIVGCLFSSQSSKAEKLSAMARNVCGLAAGGAAMVFTPAEPDESEQERIAKLALAMTVGNAAGRIAYNVTSSCCTLYRCCLKRAANKMNHHQLSNDKKISLHSQQ